MYEEFELSGQAVGSIKNLVGFWWLVVESRGRLQKSVYALNTRGVERNDSDEMRRKQ